MNDVVATTPTPEWSQEDIDWLNNYVKIELRGVAMRYGRPLFTMAFRIGLINHCITTLAQRLSKNRDLFEMCNMLAQATNDQSVLALKAIAMTQEQLIECKTDIERVGAMQQSTPQGQAQVSGKKVSPGGIILDS